MPIRKGARRYWFGTSRMIGPRGAGAAGAAAAAGAGWAAALGFGGLPYCPIGPNTTATASTTAATIAPKMPPTDSDVILPVPVPMNPSDITEARPAGRAAGSDG